MNLVIRLFSQIAVALVGALVALLVQDAWKNIRKHGFKNWFRPHLGQIATSTGAALILVFSITTYQSYGERANVLQEAREALKSRPQPAAGWRYLGSLSFADVRWKVRVPHITQSPPVFVVPEPLDCETADVVVPAICPKCAADFSESAAVLSGYSWKCSKCGLSVRSNSPMHRVALDAQPIATAECRKGSLSQP